MTKRGFARHSSSSSPAAVLVADPPWPFRDPLPGSGRGARKHYSLLSLKEIQKFDLPPLADDAYLFLWRVASQVEEAYSVVRAWGFQPKAELIWLKRTINGKRHLGMGHHLRSEHETCIVAVRGRIKPLVRNQRTTFEATIGRHSEKPDEFYEIVERVAAGPYVELFARRRRPGWICLGDEIADVRSASSFERRKPVKRATSKPRRDVGAGRRDRPREKDRAGSAS